MAEYESAVKTPLKFKSDTSFKKKKKKKEIAEAKKVLEQVSKVSAAADVEALVKPREEKLVPRTKAERAFLMMKEKKQMERIMEKATKSHKQRVEEFNRQLDSLTEHYDIPKVSWTK